MEKKLAVWFLQRHYARNIDEALEFIASLEKGEFPDAMLEANRGNMDLLMELGQITAEKLKPYFLDKLAMAEKMIAFWAEHPKDTNAIFFNKEYNTQFGDSK